MDMKRGFITVATGKYYCWLAENLMRSYRLFCGNQYPFYVITDKAGEKRLKKVFDGVIVMDNPTYTYLDKLMVYQNSPFEETVFIDADSHIAKDINYLIELFSNNSSEISCLGDIRRFADGHKPNHFGDVAVKKFNLTQYVAFNGGVYYFKKSPKAEEGLNFIFNDLIPNYYQYELKLFDGKKADEPLIGLMMLLYNFKPLNIEGESVPMRCCGPWMQSLQWNIKAQEVKVVCYGQKYQIDIVHYGTASTKGFQYLKYNIKIKGLYKKTWGPIVGIQIVFSAIKWGGAPRQWKAFFKWFFAHFTITHFKYRWGQIKRLFTRKKKQ